MMVLPVSNVALMSELVKMYTSRDSVVDVNKIVNFGRLP